MPIIHRTGSVISGSTPGSVLVHSCNGQGIWGAGVAKAIGAAFPEALEHYVMACHFATWRDLRGTAFISTCEDRYVASLLVSQYFGRLKDSPIAILGATTLALVDLFTLESWGRRGMPREFHSPRFNAGLFGVPWERTEAILAPFVESSGVTWTAWTP